MTPKQWSRIKDIVEQAWELDNAARESYLDDVCETAAVRQQVEQLLADSPTDSGFLETPLLADMGPREETGALIGPYKLVRSLGKGGMGHVYLAHREEDGFALDVAVKLIRTDIEPQLIEQRFRTERRILAALEHPNIARFLDGGTTSDGRPYAVMEYVRGEPIDVYCNSRQLGIDMRLDLFKQVCDAVHFAHQNLVIHRDIKPSNILVTADGVPKLLDFGIAKVMKSDVTHLTTAGGQTPMTPEFASPEQVKGELVSTVSDVFALGGLLYRLLAGCSPYGDSSRLAPFQLVKAICEQDPIPPGETFAPQSPNLVERAGERGAEATRLRRRLNGELDQIVLMAMRKEPNERYASALQLAEDIDRFTKGFPVHAHRPSWRYQAVKFARRNKASVSLGAAFIMLLMIFAVTMTIQQRRAEKDRDRMAHAAKFLVDMVGDVIPYESDESVNAASVIDVQRTLLGDNHLDVAESLFGLGSVSDSRGHQIKAMYYYQQSLLIRLKTLGPSHPDVLANRNTLAWIFIKAGQFDQAEQQFRLTINSDLRMSGDARVTRAMQGLASLKRQQGDCKEAVKLFKKALMRSIKTQGSESLGVASAMQNLAMALSDQGDRAGALSNYEDAIQIYRTQLEGDHVSLANALLNLGIIHGNNDRPDLSEPILREAVAIYQKSYESESSIRAYAEGSLGLCLRRLGLFEEAEPLLLNALKAASNNKSRPDRYTMALERVRLLYHHWEKPEKMVQITKTYSGIN